MQHGKSFFPPEFYYTQLIIHHFSLLLKPAQLDSCCQKNLLLPSPREKKQKIGRKPCFKALKSFLKTYFSIKHLANVCTSSLLIVTPCWGHHSHLCALPCNHFQAEMSSLPSLFQATSAFHTQGTSVCLHLTACQVERHSVPPADQKYLGTK